jgi:hypothetical protein
MTSRRGAAWLLAAASVLFACQTNDETTEAPKGPLNAPSLRRLSALELETAASRLLGKPVDLASALPPDARQHDFSRNNGAAIDALSLLALYDASASATQELDVTALPVPTRLDELTKVAFGRAPTAEENTALQAVFDAGAAGSDYDAGIALVLRAILGSTSFLYEASLGETAQGSRRLSPAELARSLSWLMAGEPPDSALLTAAERGDLEHAPGRRAQAARLLQRDSARLQFQRFVGEWLGLYRLDGLAKAPEVEPSFSSLVPTLRQNTQALIDSAIVLDGGRLETLLQGNAGQPGLLQQRSFLAVFAHERESAPVLRGQAVLERLLCRTLVKPAELGLDVTLPELDPSRTTRERYAAHSANPSCRTCHASLDAIGFTFEGFDAAGNPRTSEAGRPVDTSGDIDLDGAHIPLADSTDLSRALSSSQEARDCAARQVVRFALGQSVPELEVAFLERSRSLPLQKQSAIMDLFVAYVESDLFAWRAEAVE